ncbi:MAG: hypothetical protein JNM88_02420, partial [Chitinophagaceae bacterium]|nr:hypothetical protein [Chitinophagaceae bacterium]
MKIRLKNILLFIALLLAMVTVNAQPQPAECQYKKGVRDYLDRIGCPGDYNYLKGKSLTEKFGQ